MNNRTAITLPAIIFMAALLVQSVSATVRVFQFSGPLSTGGTSFVATLEYDDQQTPSSSTATLADYPLYSFDLVVNGTTRYTRDPASQLQVANDLGFPPLDYLFTAGVNPGYAGFGLIDNLGSVVNSTTLPATLSLSSFSLATVFAYGASGSVEGTINSITVQYQLTTSANPSAGGTVSPATGYYNQGSVAITATANLGYTFTGFSGELSGTINPQTLNLTGPASVTANFTDARGEKGFAKAAIAWNLGSTDKRIQDAVTYALGRIDESLAAGLWSDGSHLTARGNRVFGKEKEAASQLMDKILKNYTGQPVATAAMNALNDLLTADMLLASVAINEVKCIGDKDCLSELTKANVEMGKASTDSAAGKYDNSIDHYGHAWEHAMNAAKKAFSKESAAAPEVPTDFSLSNNFPNPFNPTTVVGYSVPPMAGRDLVSTDGRDGQLPTASNVRLVVYDVIGREVSVLVNERKEPGSYTVEFDASGLASGVYFYRLTAGSFVQTKKLILLR